MTPDEDKTKEQIEIEQEMEKASILRNKSWEELTLKEQIERMRVIYKQENERLVREVSGLRNIINQIQNHSHKENGDIVVPPRFSGRGFGLGEVTAGIKSEKVYF